MPRQTISSAAAELVSLTKTSLTTSPIHSKPEKRESPCTTASVICSTTSFSLRRTLLVCLRQLPDIPNQGRQGLQSRSALRGAWIFHTSRSFTNSGSTRDGLQSPPGADNNGGCNDTDNNGRGSGTDSSDHHNNKQRPELGRDTQPKVAPPQRVVRSCV